MRKYFAIFKISFTEAITYRGKSIVWILNGLFWFGVFPFVWLTIYGDNESLNGVSKSAMLSYFFFLPLIDTVTLSWVYDDIENDVKNGDATKTLLQPVNYLFTKFCEERGWNLSRAINMFFVMGIVYVFVHPYIEIPTFTLNHLALLVMLPISITLYFLCCSLIGFMAFFTTKIDWLKHVWWVVQNISFGYVAPLAFFPVWAQHIISFTPFPLLMQTPLMILLGRLDTETIVQSVIAGMLWIALLGTIALFMWKKALKRLESVGI